MNTTINIHGDKLIVQKGDIVIERSLSDIAEDMFRAPPPAPKHSFRESEVQFLMDNLEKSENLCPERQVTFGIFNGGLGHSVYIVNKEGGRRGCGLCADCNCI